MSIVSRASTPTPAPMLRQSCVAAVPTGTRNTPSTVTSYQRVARVASAPSLHTAGVRTPAAFAASSAPCGLTWV